jgi:hypothetical protein
MVPVFLPAVVVPHAVLEEEKAIIEAEGWFHVAGRYYRSAPDADKVRRLEAERRVTEKERLPLICAFCFERIGGQVAVIIAMRPVHPACAKEFDRWITEHPSENDPRWLEVNDVTPVTFEGKVCRWGDLMLADRKTVEMQSDGSLIGGYPL